MAIAAVNQWSFSIDRLFICGLSVFARENTSLASENDLTMQTISVVLYKK
jgi:hypothetical protein